MSSTFQIRILIILIGGVIYLVVASSARPAARGNRPEALLPKVISEKESAGDQNSG